MSNGWVKDKEFGTHYVFKKSGKIANDDRTDDAFRIAIKEHFNGSGKGCFGGASAWPALSLEIGFQVGEEHKRGLYIKKLKELVDQIEGVENE